MKHPKADAAVLRKVLGAIKEFNYDDITAGTLLQAIIPSPAATYDIISSASLIMLGR